MKAVQELQFEDLPLLYFILGLEYLDPVLLTLDLVDEVGAVLDEDVEQRGDEHVVADSCVAVAVDVEVQVQRDQEVEDNPAELMPLLRREQEDVYEQVLQQCEKGSKHEELN